MMDEPASSLQFRVARALRCTRAPRFPYRSGYSFSASEATICSEPLMESFSTGRRARLCRGSAQCRDATGVLEALLQCHIPSPPLDIGRLLVVAVFIGGGYEWWR